MLEPAHSIIQLCGGFASVASMTDRSEIRVRRWTYPKDRGGTGGLIPADCQQTLLSAARAKGIPLTPAHFFPETDVMLARDEEAHATPATTPSDAA